MKDIGLVRFTETQTFAAWAYVLLGLLASAVLGCDAFVLRIPIWRLLWDGAVMALTLNLLCLRTQLTDTGVIVTFGALFPLYRRRIAIADIASAEAVTYSPLAEYGGWGIKGWGRNIALNARGNRGVRLILRGSRRVLIGSQRPEMLAEALTAPR